jgi:hypothetical protein
MSGDEVFEGTGIVETAQPVNFEMPSTPGIQVQQETMLGAQLPGSSAPIRFDETIREQELQKVKNISAARGNKKPKIEDLVDYFEEDHLARYGRQLDPYDEADFRTAIDAAADEVGYQLKQSETGAGWYDTDVKTTFESMAEIPALKSMRNNETDRVIWTALAAPTSIGNNVDLNTKAATAAMLQYKKTGKIPTSPPKAGAVTEGLKGAGWGAKQQSVAAGMKVIDRLITDLGEEGFADWWLSPHTLGELTAVRKAAGLSGAPSGLSGGKNSMHLGAMVLGDKTGKYSLNLNGYEGPTKDSWFSRTYNRHFGNMKDNKGLPIGGPRSATERRRMEEFVTAMKAKLEDTGLSEQDIQAVLWFYEQNLFTDLGVVSRPDHFQKVWRRLMSNSEYDQQFAEAMALKLRLNREQRSAGSEQLAPVREPSAPNGDLRQEMEWDPNGPETEEDAIRSEALRRLKVRRLFQERPDPTQG